MIRIHKYIPALLAVLVLHSANAQAKHREESGFLDVFTFGIEGSYIGTVASHRHFNFISSYGYRVDRKFTDTRYRSNGEFLMHIGANISDRFNLSLYTGKSGIGRYMLVTPLTLRGTYYFGKDPMKSRWLVYLDAGPGFSGSGNEISASGMFKAGTGYRIPLGKYTRLDFLISYRNAMANKRVLGISSASSIYIAEENLRKNDALFFALTFGIGITF